MSVTDALQLNKTEIFAKIRAGLTREQQTQNLLECKDDLIFAWDSKDCCLLVTNWRAVTLNKPYAYKFQTLVPSTPQNFDVNRLVVSVEGSLIVLAGPRGLAILELPRRWGDGGQFMEGKSRITCRTHNLDAKFFVNNPQTELRQVRWHPGSTTDSHLLTLLSDNTIRVYNNTQLRQVWRVGPMPIKSTKSNTNTSICNFGETVVDFDIAPPVKVESTTTKNTSTSFEEEQSNALLTATSINQNNTSKFKSKATKVEWPILVLRENGNIYMLMAGLDTDKTRLQGPLTILPQSNDNYGLESCAILCIPSLPVTLVIAESNGRLHHALLLETEIAEDSFNDVDEDIRIEPAEWAVHVLETVELELGLPNVSAALDAISSGYSCSIYLKRDYINELRYFAFHNTGLHVISINFIAELQRYVDSKVVNDIVSLSTTSSAEYIVCTKIDASDRINPVLGFVLLQMPASLVLLLGSGQVVSLKVVIDVKLLDNTEKNAWQALIADDMKSELSGPTFLEHIKSLLQRSVTQPILSVDKSDVTSPHECYELLNQAIDVLRAQYLKRHELVRSEFSKRINRIRLQKEQQCQEIENLEKEREIISERAHKLAERFEEISENQENLLKNCHGLMRQVNMTLPGNVVADKDFAEEVTRANKTTRTLTTELEKVKQSIQKQNYHIAKNKKAVDMESFELPEKQTHAISSILADMAVEIDRQIKEVKNLNKMIGI